MMIDGFEKVDDLYAYQVDRSKSVEYGKEYHDKYEEYSKTDRGDAILKYRSSLIKNLSDYRFKVRAIKEFNILDFGCGYAQLRNTLSYPIIYHAYDINEYSAKSISNKIDTVYIKENPEKYIYDCVCFFDSLEHIKEIAGLPKFFKTRSFIVSIPIFSDLDKIQESRHFRPDEHYWYFTDKGIRWFFESFGYYCISSGDEEIKAGREDIYTYVFKK
jgi:hypothetical protein